MPERLSSDHHRGSSRGRRWLGPVVATLLATISPLAIRGTTAPAPGSGVAGFSVDDAWRHIEEIARAPHPPGTAEHGRVRAYVLGQLEEVGLVVDTQTALHWIERGSVVQGARVRNVMGRLPGTASSGAVLLLSHYDSKPVAPGAADDGVGVATVLETARVLASGPAPQNDLIFLFTDAEEWNMLGAREFAAHHPWMDDVAVMLNFEARGTSGLLSPSAPHPKSDPLDVRVFEVLLRIVGAP